MRPVRAPRSTSVSRSVRWNPASLTCAECKTRILHHDRLNTSIRTYADAALKRAARRGPPCS
eukprot:882115-Prymnesium_polylepis.1